MSDVTIVCCYNDEKVYQDFVSTVKSQTCPCEIIGIDNRGNRAFTSCAAAYNSVIDRVRTKFVVYSHQDILLKGSDCLEKFVGFLEGLGREDILGVAGSKFDSPSGFSNIAHRNSQTGEIVHGPSSFPECGIIECDTVDECFFGAMLNTSGPARSTRKCATTGTYTQPNRASTPRPHVLGRSMFVMSTCSTVRQGGSARSSSGDSTSCAGSMHLITHSSRRPAGLSGRTLRTCSRDLCTCGFTRWPE